MSAPAARLERAERMTAARAAGAQRFSERMAALRAEMADRPPVLGPAAVSLSLVDVGFCVWSKRRVDANDEPVGGVVLDVVDKVDTETGERQRAFLTLDPFRTRPRLSFHRLAEADVAADAIELPEAGRCAALARRLCEEVAIDGHKRRTGLLEPRHAEYVVFAHRLVGVVMGGL